MSSDHRALLEALSREYRAAFPRSAQAHQRAERVLVDGVSHGARLFAPYPFRISAADGAYVRDLDGHEILDYWQGHYTNILGHNPAVVREALVQDLAHGWGLQTGLPEERQTEFAEALAAASGAEAVRLTTAGTLATMYALMLAKAFTGRRLVVKVAGGWHGANPMALKGVGRVAGGFDRVDSAGVSAAEGDEIVVTTFNDADTLEALFRQRADRIAGLIFEPCLGAGFLPATPEFMAAARDLTARYGALLILDEVITGFRFCAGGMQRLYGVQADLTTFGKIVGGGMPISVVAGRRDVLDLAAAATPNRVWFNGGTFSAHPLALLAGTTLIRYLVAHEAEVYADLGAKAERLRRGIEGAFARHGITAVCTGCGVPGTGQGGSLISVCFPYGEGNAPTSAEQALDPDWCDVTLRERVLKLGLLLEGVNVVHGLGAVSTAHTQADIDRTVRACEALAARLAACRDGANATRA